MSLIWDKGNRGHAAKHGVTDAEIEQLFSRPYVEVLREPEEWDTETQLRAYGTTAQGRYLTAAFTERESRIRPITAWPMTKEEFEIYVENSNQ